MLKRKLVLIRHSRPEIVPDIPASRWHLSAEGRRLCAPLARMLSVHAPDVVVSSVEPKAVETGQIVAAHLGLPFETGPGLHEHPRHSVGLIDRAQFEARVAALFEQPEQLVFGEETAAQAKQRFAAAVQGALAQHAGQTVAIVTHGTVLTLLVAPLAGAAPFEFWKELGLPAFVVCALPDLKPLTVVNHIP